MNTIKALSIAFGIALSPAIAHAETPSASPAAASAAASAIKEGAMVFTADGRRIGRVDRIKLNNGAPAAVSIIYSGRFIYVPASSLTASDRGFTSSLTKAELAKL